MHDFNLLLLAGVPRSGTTVLAKYVCSKFGYQCSGETHFWDCAYKNGKVNIENLPSPTISDLKIFKAYSDIPQHGNGSDIFLALLRAIHGNTAKFICEKTPGHLYYLKDILCSIPGSKGLIIVRDFCDVICSMDSVEWADPSIYNRLKRVFTSYMVARSLKMQYKSRIFLVSYKDFCMQTSSVEAALSRFFCKVPFSSENVDDFSLYDPSLEPWKAKVSDSLRFYSYPITTGGKLLRNAICRSFYLILTAAFPLQFDYK
jgi:hypothetical protein